METLGKLKELVECLSVDTTKFFEKENKSAGIRARKSAQDIKALCQELRKEILQVSKEK
jgi:hypothetical protein|tara:strand:- start:255 stop:431 length:177 start_codon:yes stop_codon:yes gene_type:complete